MPAAVSRKQWRLMQAILHGKADPSRTGRGVPPKSIAAKYSPPSKDAPENHGENRGGHWGEEHHKRAKEKVKEARIERKQHKKKSKKELHKAFEEFYQKYDLSATDMSSKHKAAAVIVIDDNGRILLGDHKGGLAFPGGGMDDSDNGDYALTALRELKEETGLTGRNPIKVWEGKHRKNNVIVYIVESWTGDLKGDQEMKNLRWFEPQDIDWDNMRGCCRAPLKEYLKNKLGKSLKDMLALEKIEILEKNIIRQKGDAVLEVTHGDALRLVGNGMFRLLREVVRGMQDESFKDVRLDTYTLSIRRHYNDVYSGRVSDGHKVIYQFMNKSLPELTAALMSVFEWYLPEDEAELQLLDDSVLSDDTVSGGLNHLIDEYKRHNIGNIYQEMETIREHIRNGVAVDLQQVEAHILSLFEKLEAVVHDMSDKHNKLADMSSSEMDNIEFKLRDLQNKVEELSNKPETVEAFSARPINPSRIHDENYPYLPRPQIEIAPSGKIRITFASEWTNLEKENFLSDMRAKVLKRSRSNV